jgi:hypothetical protein
LVPDQCGGIYVGVFDAFARVAHTDRQAIAANRSRSSRSIRSQTPNSALFSP